MQRAVGGLAIVALAGCGGGGAALPSITGGQSVISAVQVLPNVVTLGVGQRLQLQWVATDQLGHPIAGGDVRYQVADPALASVDFQGVVTGLAAGATTLTATVTWQGSSKSGTATIEVSAPPAAGGQNIVTTPGTSFLPASLTIQANDSVTWEFSGAIHNVTFASGAPPAGNISDRNPGSRVTRVFPTAGSYPYECTRHAGMTATITVLGTEPAAFTSLLVSPTSPAIVVGGSVTLVATAKDQFGTTMTGLPAPAFATNAGSVATVSSTGVVTGVAAGSAIITATVTDGGVTHSASATVTVSSPASGGAVFTTPNNTFSPATVTIQTGETVTWQFSGAVHNVTFTGAVPAGGNIPDQQPGNAASRTLSAAGTYRFECTRHSGMTGEIVVQGSQPASFSSVTMTPSSPAIPIGGTVQLTVIPRDQFGTAMTGLPAPSFTTSTASVATVNQTGLVAGITSGTASITATIVSGGVTHTATSSVTVSNPQAPGATFTTPNNSFSPGTVTIQQGQTVTWQFSGAVHNVTFAGAAPTGGNIPDQQPGNAVSRTFPIAGTYGFDCTRHSGMTGQVVVQGSQPSTFTSVTVSPTNPAMVVGGTVQLTATARDQFGTAMTGLPAPVFTTSAPSVATVTATGLVTGIGAGTATITASVTSGGVTHTGAATATVSVPTSSSATVTTPGNSFAPSSTTIPVGGTVTWQFSGTHNVTFGAAAPAGGNIPDQTAGNAVSRTFGTAGTYDYQCTRHNGMTGQVMVQGATGGGFSTLNLTPASLVLSIGQTGQLVATPLDAGGVPVTGLGTPGYSSSNPGVASVSPGGLVTAVAGGSATITASLTDGGTTRTGTATIAVVTGPVATITTPGNTFQPNDITVTPGTTVIWQISGTIHNVTFKNATPPGGAIGDTPPGNAVARLFTTAGTYDYECTIHKGMKGRVRVQ